MRSVDNACANFVVKWPLLIILATKWALFKMTFPSEIKLKHGHIYYYNITGNILLAWGFYVIELNKKVISKNSPCNPKRIEVLADSSGATFK